MPSNSTLVISTKFIGLGNKKFAVFSKLDDFE